MSSSDPHPELRCRCANRRRLPEDGYPYCQWPDDYYDKCHRRATQEDGLCDVKKEVIIWAIEAPREIETLQATAREARAISSWVAGQAVPTDGDFRELRKLLDRLELKE